MMLKSCLMSFALGVATAMAIPHAFADGESLAETGGYVTTTAQLAFKGITLADLGTAYVITGQMNGGHITAKDGAASFCNRTASGAAVTYEAQYLDGDFVKCAILEFSEGEGGVYVKGTGNKYSSTLTDYGKSWTGTTTGNFPSNATEAGYGIHNLGLVEANAVSSINLNFHNGTGLATTTDVGAPGYAVIGSAWSQMQGTNNNTLNGLNAVVSDGGSTSFSTLSSMTAKITGTRGTWSCSEYTGASDVRYGYIDEDSNNTTPTVTITNIPFDYYKVVFIPSTDTSDSKFGYITVNGRNYSSDNTEKASDRDYGLVVDSTAAWGKTRIADYLHGVNYLVTPALANNSGKTLTVTGHKSDGRGCIAAIQIVRAEEPDTRYSVTATGDVTWSTKAGLTVNSGTWASGNTIQLVNNQTDPVTVTFDETVNSDELILSGSGTTIFQFNDTAYNQISTFNFDDVSGEVVLDDYMQTVSFIPPATGAVRYQGTATLTSVPCASGAIPYTVIVDQPLTVSEFQLAGVKNDYRFGENFVGTFSSRFVLGNNTGANQNVTQLGGSITVNGDKDITNIEAPYNSASVLLGHWGNLTVRLNTYGGTFDVPNAAVKLGHDGACIWTIGDGESVDDDTAVVGVKGVLNTTGHYGAGSGVVLQQGGTLNIGASGVNIPYATMTLAGGKLATSADTAVSVTASTITSATGTDTEINTVNGLTIASSIGGAGSVTKTGAGTLTLSVSAASTGTLAVDAGTVTFNDDVTWAGTVSVGVNGTLDITDADVSETETVYIPVGGTLSLAEGATVKLNGTAINTDVWELSGGTFVNKTLKTAVTTATDDFAFSTATWESALGAGAEIDWAGSLSEVRVHANNAAPATATVDVNAAEVKDFVVDGSGDMTFVANNGGSLVAEAYDFSEATGRVEYDLSTGSAPVTSGSNTLLLGGGSGVPTVAAGKTLTLGPWGSANGTEYTYGSKFAPASGSTFVFAPGEGNIQKCGGFSGTSTSTTIAVTNGTLSVNQKGGDESVFFGSNSVRIDNGGIVSLDAQDSLGYSQTRALTINKGGVLAVKVRDTLRRTVTLNGGTIEVQGANGGRALDFFSGNVINVTDDSTIQAVNNGSVSNPTIWFRNGTTVINIDDNKTLTNNVSYVSTSDGQSKGSVKIRGTMNNSTGNGVMQMNGFNGNPLTFIGTATIGESGKPVIYELNCEHQNGRYTVNAASRLLGSGSITGNGGVTLAAENSKLCGSLTVNNLTAASGGTYGDQWNTVSAKVATSYFAAGTQTIQNGSFTIGAACVVTNAAGTTDTSDATFSIAANGNLVLEKPLTVGGFTVASGGTITLAQDAALTVNDAVNVDGLVVGLSDFESGDTVLTATSISGTPAAMTGDYAGWNFETKNNGDDTYSLIVKSPTIDDSDGNHVGYVDVDGTTAVITNTPGSSTITIGPAITAVTAYPTADSFVLLGCENVATCTFLASYYIEGAAQPRTQDISSAFAQSVVDGVYRYTLAAGNSVMVNEESIAVRPAIDTASASPMEVTEDLVSLAMKTIPGLWYCMTTNSNINAEFAVDANSVKQAKGTSTTLYSSIVGTPSLMFYKVGVSVATPAAEAAE